MALVKDVFTFIGCIIVSAILVLTAILLMEFVPGVPDHKLNDIQEDMSKAEIEAFFGKPAYKHETHDGIKIEGGYWVYSKRFSLAWFEVQFDEHDKLAWVDEED